jgi:ABC-type multidrug transport system fused ATPase/permease subunit
MKYTKLSDYFHRYKKYVIIIIFTLFILSTFSLIIAYVTPITIQKSITINNLTENTTYDFSTIAKPSTLYPKGGKILPDNVIFSALSDHLILSLNSNISAEYPILIDATSSINYSIIARDIWTRDFEVLPATKVQSEGTLNSLFDEDVSIDITAITEYIRLVEEETLVRANEYSLIIKYSVSGAAYGNSDNKIYDIATNIEIPFSISGQYLKFTGESSNKEVNNLMEITDTKIIPQYFSLLFMDIPIPMARLVFSILSFFTIIPLLIVVRNQIKLTKSKVAEMNLLVKKYNSRIIEITDTSCLNSVPHLALKSFKSLFQIAEEKEEPILRFSDSSSGMIYYYMLGTSILYYFVIPENKSPKGSEIIDEV